MNVTVRKDNPVLALKSRPQRADKKSMNTTHTLKVRGLTLRTRTSRRFLVVKVRPEAVVTNEGTYVAFTEIEKRTDDITTARKAAAKVVRYRGMFAVVIDLTTGEEI